MGQCNVCGNSYDKSFDVIDGGRTYTFDSFECAINKLAPTCSHCRCRIIGHGLESQGAYFCCAHCAGASGVRELKDRS